MTVIYGELVDHFGRCIHYHSAEDIVANQCFECKKYYACYQCHNKYEAHTFKPWPINQQNRDQIVLCGMCLNKMDYFEYKKSEKCPNCHHMFNPNCSFHADSYFQFEK